MSTTTTTEGAAVRPRLRWGLPAYIVLVLAAIVLALVVPKTGYILNISLQATTYAIAVLGLTIVLGLCGQINLAQAAFFGLGAYAVDIGQTEYGVNFWVCLLLGTCMAAGFGALLGASTLRLGGHYLAMVTISFQQIVTLVLINWIPVTKGPDGVRAIPRPGFLADGSTYLALCIFMLALLGFMVWKLRDTRLGRAMRAVRDNELAAGVAGIDVYRTKVTAFRPPKCLERPRTSITVSEPVPPPLSCSVSPPRTELAARLKRSSWLRTKPQIPSGMNSTIRITAAP